MTWKQQLTAAAAAAVTALAALAALIGSMPDGDQTPITVSIAADPATIEAGQQATLSWSVQGYTATLNGQAKPWAGREVVTPDKTTTYTLVVEPGGHTASATVTVGIAPQPPPEGLVISGYHEFEELHVHEGETLTLLPGAELVRKDVPPANPGHADGGIVVHGHLRAVRGPNDPPIVIRSQNPTGHRGHLMIHGTAELDGIEVRDFGRTTIDPLGPANPIGRYAVHWHLAGDNGRQSRIENCLIHDTVAPSRWRIGIAIHGTHGVVCRGNTVQNKGGAGIYLEDGTERDNLIENNVIRDIHGSGVPRPDSRPAKLADMGHDGTGIWARGFDNIIRGNRVERAVWGYMYFPVGLPDAITKIPVREFKGNVAAHCSKAGLEYWWLGNGYGQADQWSTFEDFTCTDSTFGIYGYTSGKARIVNPTISRCRFGCDAGDYKQNGWEIVGGSFTDCEVGFIPTTFLPEPMVVRGTRFKNKIDVQTQTLYHSNDARALPPRKLTLLDCQLEGTTKVKRWFRGTNEPAIRDYVKLDQLFIQNGSTVQQIFYSEQRADFIVPQTSDGGRTPGCPVTGLTNAQAWEQHGVAIAGAVAPAGAVSQPGIVGLVK